MSDSSPSPSDSSISSSSPPSDTGSPRTIIPSEDLPLPTAPRPFSTKKSHARKQPLGHIPRPRNAFILFRCDYGRQNPRKGKDRDQNDLSRVVGTMWRNMTVEQRAPWVFMADEEKRKHAALYPGYKYIPRNKRAETMIQKEAEKAVEAEVVKRNSKDTVTVYYPPWATRRTLTYFARRATSCPPSGAVSIEPYTESLDRAMVTTMGPKRDTDAKKDKSDADAKEKDADKEEQPASSSATEDVFVPSAYDIPEEVGACRSDVEVPASVRVDADRTLSSYTIEPPGGTSSWGQEASPPSVYVPDTGSSSAYQHYDHFNTSPLIYTEQGNFAVPQRRQQFNLNYEECWAPEIPRFQPPTPNESVPRSSLRVPPVDYSTFEEQYDVEGNYINQWSSERVPSSSEISPSSSVESTEYYALYSGSTSSHYWAPVIPQQQPASSPTGYDLALQTSSAADNPPSTSLTARPVRLPSELYLRVWEYSDSFTIGGIWT